MAEIYKYAKTLREDDIELILLEESDMPIASSVVAREKAKLQEQIQNIVNSLNDYYLKTETYSKEEVNGLFEQLTGLGIEFKEVQTLPTTGENKYIYLVPKTGSTNDIFDEYIWVKGKFEKIGSTAINLADYYTKTETDAKLATKGGLSSANTWSGTNNFTGNLTKNGANVATEGQIPKVDSTLSTTSTNAIQNKVVKTELDKKGSKSSANTWSANNNFTGGLQKNGVDVATTTQVNQKITMPTALEGGYLKYTQEKGAHWALVESSGGGSSNASKDIYLINKDLGLTTGGYTIDALNELLGITENLKVGNMLVDTAGNMYKVKQVSASSGYDLTLVNGGSSGKVVYFLNTEITDPSNFPQASLSWKYPTDSFIMDKTGKVYRVASYIPHETFPDMMTGSYRLVLMCNPSSGGGSFATPTPLKNGDNYPEFIYFDTSRDITDILAGLTYGADGIEGVSFIMQLEELLYMVSIDIGAFSIGSDAAGLGGYALAIVDPLFSLADIIFVSNNAPVQLLEQYYCVHGWNQTCFYTGDLSSQTITLPTTFNFMYSQNIEGSKVSTIKNESCFKIFSWSYDGFRNNYPHRVSKRFLTTASLINKNIAVALFSSSENYAIEETCIFTNSKNDILNNTEGKYYSSFYKDLEENVLKILWLIFTIDAHNRVDLTPKTDKLVTV